MTKLLQLVFNLKFLIIIGVCILPILSHAQIYGSIADSDGNPLPFASIYIQGTSQGTTSNIEGNYNLQLEPGNYKLVFQYVGCETKIERVSIDQNPLNLDVILDLEAIELNQVTISANAEDPAYAIMRKTIKKRDYYKNHIESFKADMYIKGMIQSKESPEKFMGIEIGDMEGILDSTRQGIVYLSESQSTLYFQAPNKFKEVMYASKVAGESNGVSFNQFSDSYFNFYEEHLKFSRDLLSPLADNAFSYYRYKLLGSTLDKDGNTINKIEVIPKSANDPIFFGTIYITEDLWNIHSLDLAFEGKAAKENIFDTIRVKQVFVPVESSEKWAMLTQVMDFNMKIFAFKFGGCFSYAFSNYELDPKMGDDIFNSEIFKIEKDAVKKNLSYWDSIRPIPLTTLETKDYAKKDSLEILWNSKTYRDSIDGIQNKFTPLNLIFGYSYQRSFNNETYYYNSPLSTFQFNAVEGYKLALNVGYSKQDKDFTKYTYINPQISYSFAEERWRYQIEFRKKFNSINNARFSISGGRKTQQFNELNPISTFSNTIESLFGKNNFIKIYEKSFIKTQYSQEVVNGLKIKTSIEYANRKPLTINTNHSLFDTEEIYESNSPGLPDFYEPFFEEHKAAIADIEIEWNPRQKFMSFDTRRIRVPSSFPTIKLKYKKGIAVSNSSVDFDRIILQILDRNVNLNLWGYFSYSLEGGRFLNDTKVEYADFFHFNGNQSYLASQRDFLQSFKRLRYYELSTDQAFGKIHFEYHPSGKFMDKIPYLKNTNMKFVLGYASLFTRDINYREFSIGIDGIGFAGIPFLRLDYTWSFPNPFNDHGFTISGSGAF